MQETIRRKTKLIELTDPSGSRGWVWKLHQARSDIRVACQFHLCWTVHLKRHRLPTDGTSQTVSATTRPVFCTLRAYLSPHILRLKENRRRHVGVIRRILLLRAAKFTTAVGVPKFHKQQRKRPFSFISRSLDKAQLFLLKITTSDCELWHKRATYFQRAKNQTQNLWEQHKDVTVEHNTTGVFAEIFMETSKLSSPSNSKPLLLNIFRPLCFSVERRGRRDCGRENPLNFKWPRRQCALGVLPPLIKVDLFNSNIYSFGSIRQSMKHERKCLHSYFAANIRPWSVKLNWLATNQDTSFHDQKSCHQWGYSISLGSALKAWNSIWCERLIFQILKKRPQPKRHESFTTGGSKHDYTAT